MQHTEFYKQINGQEVVFQVDFKVDEDGDTEIWRIFIQNRNQMGDDELAELEGIEDSDDIVALAEKAVEEKVDSWYY